QLRRFERIGFAGSDQLVTNGGIEYGKAQVEPPQHLHQPLMNEVLRHHDQGAADAAPQPLLMKNETGLDGLAEPDLVGEQDARCMPAPYFVGDVELMRQQLHTRAEQTERGGDLVPVLMRDGIRAQAEAERLVDLADEQPIERTAE